MSHRQPLPRSKLELHIEWLKNSNIYEPLEDLCKSHSVWLETVLSPTKTKRVMQARLACYGHLRSLDMSYQEIGRVMLRDHSSVIHALKQKPGLGEPSDGAEGTESPKT